MILPIIYRIHIYKKAPISEILKSTHMSEPDSQRLNPLTRFPSLSGADSPGSSVFDLPTQLEPHHHRSPQQTYTSDPNIHNPTLGVANEQSPSFVVISGGTGCNSICSAFGNACYVLPVSDDGGSSSEIIRVLGGPSIGARCYLVSPFVVIARQLWRAVFCTKVTSARDW